MAKTATAKQKPAMKSVESVKKVVKKANTLKNGMKYQPSSGSKVGSSSSSKAVLNKKNVAKGDLVGPPPLTLQEKVNKAIEGGDSEEKYFVQAQRQFAQA